MWALLYGFIVAQPCLPSDSLIAISVQTQCCCTELYRAILALIVMTMVTQLRSCCRQILLVHAIYLCDPGLLYFLW